MASERQRGKNFSDYEKQLLQELLKKYVVILTKAKDTKTQKQKEGQWRSLMDDFICDSKVTKRDMEALKMCVNNLLKKAKKDDAIWRREQMKTGGGPNPYVLFKRLC